MQAGSAGGTGQSRLQLPRQTVQAAGRVACARLTVRMTANLPMRDLSLKAAAACEATWHCD